MRILRSPGLLVVAVLLLGLGLGGNLAMLALLDRLVLRPLAIPEPGRLVEINGEDRAGQERALGWTAFDVLTRDTGLFERSGFGRWRDLLLTGVADPENLWVFEATGEFFPLLRAKPLIGRTLEPHDAGTGAGPRVVLSHSTWIRHFGSDPSVLGRSIRLGGQAHEVVGVMGPGFAFPRPMFSAWTATPRVESQSRDARGVSYYARLREGVSLEQADRQVRQASPPLLPAGRKIEGWHATVKPVTARVTEPYRRTVWMLAGAVACLLLIACANVAGLLLVRAAGRTAEFSIRSALGASRAHLIRLLVGEAFVIAALAGLAGLVMGVAALRLVEGRFPDVVPAGESLELSGAALAAGLGLALLTVLLSASAPLWIAARRWHSLPVRGSSGDRASHRLRQALLTGQIALAVVLVAGAGLLVRSLNRTLGVNFGFQPQQALTARVPAPPALKEPVEMERYFGEILERARAVPGVRSAGVVTILPLGGIMATTTFQAEGAHAASLPPDVQSKYGVHMRAVAGDYFDALGIALLQGRTFQSSDRMGTPAVVIINRELAEHYWPGENPIGKRVSREEERTAKDWFTVVGVVENTRHMSPRARPEPELFRPLSQDTFGAFLATLVVRVHGNGSPDAVGPTIARSIHERFPDQPVTNIKPMQGWIDESTARLRTTAAILQAFAITALLMALAGVFAVAAFVARTRRRDLAIRSALGATRLALRRHVGRSVAIPLLGGCVAGLAGAIALGRLLAAELFEIGPSDPVTLAGTVLLISIGGLAALWMPAERAARIDPAVELRGD